MAKNDGIGAKRIPSWGFRPKSTYFLESTSSDRDQSVHLRVMSIHRAGGKLHITEHHSYLGRLQVINFSDLRQVLFQTCPRDEPSDLRQIPLLPGRPLGWCQNFRPVREMSPHQIVYISNQLCQFGLSPKEFITGFLTRDHPQLIYRQRTWGTDHGARSTIALVVIIRNLFHGNHGATGHWDDLIQAEVSSDGLTPEESEELEVEGDVYSTVMSGRADCQARSRH
ncbi:hypothetical protein MJO28_009651, partial [Puccinia striiformis f. sp. tritici]